MLVVVVVVVVVSATTSPRSLDAALVDTFLAGGSAEGWRETLRLGVLASGEAKAAFCDRVAGIVVSTSWVCGDGAGIEAWCCRG